MLCFTFQIIAIWVLPVLIMIPSLTGILGRHGLECNSRICTILEDENGNNVKNYLKLFAVAGPVLILLAADVSIFLKMRVSFKNDLSSKFSYDKDRFFA